MLPGDDENSGPTVHDLVADLHDKQKSFSIHEQTMKQVEIREQTLRQEHEAQIATLEGKIKQLTAQMGKKDASIDELAD